ncbi:O-antigen ligase family protein [Akkermansiaceae bacterium]|nr:O-antigen ligase family protein [Akkermansiaceae bacterium]
MKFAVFIYALIVIFIFPQYGLGRVATTLIIPVGFLFSTLLHRKNYRRVMNSKPFLIYITFVMLSGLTIIYSLDRLVAVDSVAKSFVVLLFSISIFSIGCSSLRLYKALLVTASCTPLLLFWIFVGNGSNLEAVDRYESSLDPNSFGYYSFVGLSALFILKTFKNNLAVKVGIIVSIIISFSFGVIYASRSTFIITVLISVLGYSFDIYNSGNSKLKTFYKFLILSVIIMFVFEFFATNLVDKLIFQRFQRLETAETPRQFHLKKAIEIGLQNPVFGVGAGNYAVIPKSVEFGSFSHNTFTEVFANFGFIGLTLYLYLQYIIFKGLKNRLRNKKIFKSHLIAQLLVVFFVFQVYSLFYVTYLDTIFMFLFSIILSGLHHQKNFKLRIKNV